MTSPGQKYPPNFKGKPPHMSPEDLIIWEKWREEAVKGAKWLYFDVGVGEGIKYEGEFPDWLVRSWIRVTQKRIDVLIQRSQSIDIVELRNGATANAVGRLLMYEMLYLDDPIFSMNVKLILVTNRYDKDLERLCNKFNIKYHVITN